jgi:predicted nucleic acid-binding protein
MPKTKLLFDTNSFQSENILLYGNEDIYYSAVVFMELMTACNDTKELKSYQKAYKDAKDEKLLILPTEQDILEAGRIQFLLAQDRKDAKGNSPKRPTKIKQEIAMDCLIATSATSQKIAIITNDNDYWEIQRFLKTLKLIKP